MFINNNSDDALPCCAVYQPLLSSALNSLGKVFALRGREGCNRGAKYLALAVKVDVREAKALVGMEEKISVQLGELQSLVEAVEKGQRPILSRNWSINELKIGPILKIWSTHD